MHKISFSYENILSLIKANELSFEVLSEQFCRTDLISSVRYIDNVGQPWGSWKKVINVLDDFVLEKNYEFKKRESSFNSNVAYFLPSTFIKFNLLEIIEILNDFNNNQLNTTLTNDDILNYFKKVFLSEMSVLVFDKLTCDVFIRILQSFSRSKIISIDDELTICCDFLRIKNLATSDVNFNLLNTRIRSLSNLKKNEHKTDYVYNWETKPRIALIISGQLRGWEFSLPKFKNKFSHLGLFDVFVSTWEDIGYTRFNLMNSYRIFDKEANDYILANKDSLNLSIFDSEIKKYIKNTTNAQQLKLNLSDALSWANSIFFNIKNGDEYPYNRMSNSEKMYYHNSYWINTLGNEFFEKYDLCIKIRPDYQFRDDMPLEFELNESQIITDTSGYLVEEWGFGLGDQLWIGRTKNLVHMLTCHNRESISYQYMNEHYPRNVFQGHLNCAIEAWANGLSISTDNLLVIKSRLSNARLLSYNELQKLNVFKS